MSDYYWMDRARAAEAQVDRLEETLAELRDENASLLMNAEVDREDEAELHRQNRELRAQVELLSKRDVLAAAFIELVQKHQELLSAVVEFKPAPTTPIKWGPTYSPPRAPEGVVVPPKPAPLTYDEVTHQLRIPEPAPLEGSWGTFSHCGKRQLHPGHVHVAIFNEGPTAPLYCFGDGAPNGS